MSEPLAPQTPSAAPVAPEKPGGFFQNLVDVYVAPREAFARIVRAPRWVLPAVAHLVVVLAFTGIWMSRMEPREFMKAQLEESGRMEKIPADQREQILDQQARFMPIFGWVGAVVGTAVIFLVVAGALLFVYRFFYSGELSFRQSLAIVCWVFFAVGLITSPLILAVMGMKGDWNISPQDALQANLALFLDKPTAAKPLYSLLSSVDLFSIWHVFLLATGFGLATRRTTASAAWGVVIPWVVIVLVKVAWAAVF
jgi:hypothetical protein